MSTISKGVSTVVRHFSSVTNTAAKSVFSSSGAGTSCDFLVVFEVNNRKKAANELSMVELEAVLSGRGLKISEFPVYLEQESSGKTEARTKVPGRKGSSVLESMKRVSRGPSSGIGGGGSLSAMAKMANVKGLLVILTQGLLAQKSVQAFLQSAILENKRVVFAYDESDEDQYNDMIGELPPEQMNSLSGQLVSLKFNVASLHTFANQLVGVLDDGEPPWSVPTEVAPDFKPKTRVWVFDEVNQWLKSKTPQSRMFVLLGREGSGKSVFAAELCQRKRSHAAVYFFDRHSQLASSAKNCVRSIARQLSQIVKGFQLPQNPASSDTTPTLTKLIHHLIVRPARDVKNQRRVVLVVLDGINQCEERFLETFFNALQTALPTLPLWLRIFVTSTPETYFRMKSQSFQPLECSLEEERGQTDMHHMVSDILHGRHGKYPEFETKINGVVQRANGSLLFVRLLKNLGDSTDTIEHGELEDDVSTHRQTGSTSRSVGGISSREGGRSTQYNAEDSGAESDGDDDPDEEIYAPYSDMRMKKLGIQSAEQFLRSIPNTINELIEYKFRSIQESEEEMYELALSLLIASREPLPYDLWQELCGFPQDEIEFRSRVVSKFSSAIRAKQGGNVRFIHNQLREWAANPSLAPKSLHVGPELGHKILAEWCWENRFDSAYALQHLIYHLCICEQYDKVHESVLNFQWLLRKLRRGSPMDVVMDCEKWYLPRAKDPDDGLRVVISAIRLGANAIDHDFRELASQLLGRIDPEVHPYCAEIVQAAKQYSPGVPWWQPLRPTLQAAEFTVPHVLTGHASHVTSLAVSSYGAHLASTSVDHTLRIWNMDADAEIRHLFSGHGGQVNQACFSPDGLNVASASDDHTCKVWNMMSGEQVFSFGHGNPVTHVQYSHDGQWLATVCDGDFWLWTSTGTLRRTLDRVFMEAITAFDFIRVGHQHHRRRQNEGAMVICGTDQGAVFSCDLLTAKVVQDFSTVHKGKVSTVKSLLWKQRGLIASASTDDEKVLIWDSDTGTKVQSIVVKGITSMAFSPDGERLLTGSLGKLCCVFDVNSGALLEVVQHHSAGVNAVCFFPDGDKVATASKDCTVQIYMSASRQKQLALAKNGTAPPDGDILWPTRPRLPISSFSFSRELDRFATSTLDGIAKIWSTETGELLHVLQCPPCEDVGVFPVRFSEDGKYLVAQHKLVFDVETGERVAVRAEDVKCVLQRGIALECCRNHVPMEFIVEGGKTPTVRQGIGFSTQTSNLQAHTLAPLAPGGILATKRRFAYVQEKDTFHLLKLS